MSVIAISNIKFNVAAQINVVICFGVVMKRSRISSITKLDETEYFYKNKVVSRCSFRTISKSDPNAWK